MDPTPEIRLRKQSAILIAVKIADQVTDRIAVGGPALGSWMYQGARKPGQCSNPRRQGHRWAMCQQRGAVRHQRSRLTAV